MEIIKNTLSVGAEKPFVLLHISDIHLSESDENDSPERKAFAADRKRSFSFAPAAMNFVKEYAQKNNYPIVNTGDLLDFITPENLRIAKDLLQSTDMMFVAGNHEYWECPNNRFHFDDAPKTYEKKNESLSFVSKHLGVDVRFFHREICGVNLVGIDDTDYCIDAKIFEKLKKVEAQKKPILLFMHIPLHSEYIGKGEKYSLNAPQHFFENCNPVDAWERKPDDLTCEICDYIRRSPFIKCVLSGHTHYNSEIIGLDAQDQIITGCNTIREITVI